MLSHFLFTEENNGVKDLYQGDILLNQQQEQPLESSAVRGLGNGLWPGGVVPYVLSREIGEFNS